MICFVDKSTPVFFLFGYRSIGKTMIIQRLSCYFRSIGMVVNSDKALSNTEFYSEECDRYLEEINRNSVAHSTCWPILLNVIKDGRKVCEFFDVP